jgi:hypothetical protein
MGRKGARSVQPFMLKERDSRAEKEVEEGWGKRGREGGGYRHNGWRRERQ